MLEVSARDGSALLGYAGLGASARQTEPSEWMNDLLIDLPAMPLENYIGVLVEEMRKSLPIHISKMPVAGHFVVAPAIVEGAPRLYTIGLVLGPAGEPIMQTNRYMRLDKSKWFPRIGVGGSGASHLDPVGDWYRNLFRLIAAFEKGRVSPLNVADFLAGLNANVSRKDSLVSPKCIVKWHCDGGGVQFYDGADRCEQDRTVPVIADGLDIGRIAKSILSYIGEDFDKFIGGDFDKEEAQKHLDKAYQEPRKKL
ncbi:hypothetical protein SZ64_07915 [Erythrobacter sp. SG61-1L]|nr:hypothetical protein SZ64_07915 [Erythrobacter sp. SG61-1L]